MSHHSSEALSSRLRELCGQPPAEPLGATGRHPRGGLSESDEGEIMIGFAADPQTQTVLINFGKPVAWIGFTAEQAIELAEMLQRKAWELRGIESPEAKTPTLEQLARMSKDKFDAFMRAVNEYRGGPEPCSDVHRDTPATNDPISAEAPRPRA